MSPNAESSQDRHSVPGRSTPLPTNVPSSARWRALHQRPWRHSCSVVDMLTSTASVGELLRLVDTTLEPFRLPFVVDAVGDLGDHLQDALVGVEPLPAIRPVLAEPGVLAAFELASPVADEQDLGVRRVAGHAGE